MRVLRMMLGAFLLAALLVACGDHQAEQQPPAEETPVTSDTPPASASTSAPAASLEQTACARRACPCVYPMEKFRCSRDSQPLVGIRGVRR